MGGQARLGVRPVPFSLTGERGTAAYLADVTSSEVRIMSIVNESRDGFAVICTRVHGAMSVSTYRAALKLSLAHDGCGHNNGH